jgi:hypothetical protein
LKPLTKKLQRAKYNLVYIVYILTKHYKYIVYYLK